MPELPELEAMAGFLHEQLDGATAVSLQFQSPRVLATAGAGPELVSGRTVDSVVRRGKFICIGTVPGSDSDSDSDSDSGSVPQEKAPLYLVFNLSKSGWLQFRNKAAAPLQESGYIQARAGFSRDNHDVSFDLTEAGFWKRLAVYIVSDPLEITAIAEMGPEPLDPDLGLATFRQLFSSRRRVKSLLIDQKTLAGIGNAYSDEVLHRAKVSPSAPASSLSPEALERLHAALVSTLGDAVEAFTALPPEKLKAAKKASMRVHGRTGEKCPVCGDEIQEIAYSGSSMQYCPSCQTEGVLLTKRGQGPD